MDSFSRLYPWTIFAIFVGVTALLFTKITTTEPNNYMDEIFHVPQVKKFCNGLFEWDPMITTLPGLYVMTLGLISPIAYIQGKHVGDTCTTNAVRAINVLFSVGNCYLIYQLLCALKDRKKNSPTYLMANAVTMSSMPVLYFYSFLYYTDQGATFLILLAYLCSLRNNHVLAALSSALAIFFRQTSVTWVIFIACSVAVKDLDYETLKNASKKKPLTTLKRRCLGYYRTVRTYLKSFSKLMTLAVKLAPYAIVVLLFMCFVYWNNGIVVGDRSNHEVFFNVPQLFYFASFTTCLLSPYLITTWRLKKFAVFLKKNPLPVILFLVLSLAAVHNFTHVHKYLLSDNRHYVFYIWKNIYQRHWAVKYILCVPYLYAVWSMLYELSNKSILWVMLFIVTLFLATIPWRLLEFRYFIIPYLIFRLHLSNTGCKFQLLLEFLVSTVVNVGTIYMYLYRPFTSPDNEGMQRFIW